MTAEQIGQLAIHARRLERERRAVEHQARMGAAQIGPGGEREQREQHEAAELAWRAAADAVLDA